MKARIDMDLTTDIIRFEDGEMDEAEVIELFQKLVDTGLAWKLQGSYGRMVMRLAEQRLIKL
jgi:hypothetical protein